MAGATFSPLVWPEGVERTAVPVNGRQRTRVRTGTADVLKAINALETATSWPASSIILAFEDDGRGGSNVDQGAAAWFMWGDAQRCVTCDLYASQGANLSAIAQLIQSCVLEYSRGSVAAVSHALSSYTPRSTIGSAGTVEGHWSDTLGVSQSASRAEIIAAFRRRAHDAHPDKGGTRKQWDEVVTAFEQARSATEPSFDPQGEWEMASSSDEDIVWANLFAHSAPLSAPE